MPFDTAIFSSIPLLASLRKDERDAVAPLCRLQSYEKNAFIFREGDPADRIHLLVSGRVKIVKSAGSRDVIIEILGETEPVGAVAVICVAESTVRTVP